MPKLETAPNKTTTAARVVQPKTKPPAKVVYPDIKYYEGWLGGKHGPITAEKIMEWFGFETEDVYTARKLKKYPDDPPEKHRYGHNYLMTLEVPDEQGKLRKVKVRCQHNNSNRPFDEAHAQKLAQVILRREWAGPTTMPGETINGEPILISRTGQVHSGQHTGMALIIAKFKWLGKNRIHYQELWPTEPVIDKLVIFGISDSPKVVQSLDNVKPRTLADVFYTSGLFSEEQDNLSREMFTRFAATSVDWLWKRLHIKDSESLAKYQTHSLSTDFVDRHPKLIGCVKHIFTENGGSGRDGKAKPPALANLGLSPGMCAGAMYLMGSAETDPNDYHPMDPPAEKYLTWSYWDAAVNFWSALADTKSKKLQHVRAALQKIVDDAEGSRQAEKMAIIAKAWAVWVEGHSPTPDDLVLEYYPPEPDKPIRLKNHPIFGGIDLGEKQPPTAPTKAELEARKKEEREKAAREAQQKAAAEKKARENGKKNGNGNAPIPPRTKRVGINPKTA